MARRRKYTLKKGVKGPRKKNGNSIRKVMLNMARLDSFEWNLKKVLEGLPNPENKGAIFGSIRNKSINIGIEEAREYILSKQEEEAIDEDTSNELLALLDRFSKRR